MLAVVVAMAGWLYFLGKLVLMGFDWLLQ